MSGWYNRVQRLMRSGPPWLRLPLRASAALLLVAALLGSATASATGSQLAPLQATSLWAAPSATAAATSAPVGAEQQAATVQQALDLLLDRYVHPLDSAELLRGAWKQLAQAAAERQAPDPGPSPAFTGDRAANLAAFRSAFLAYVNGPQRLPDGFVPAYAAARGMAAQVGEGHTSFLDPQQYQDHLAWSRGEVKYAGIGARMRGPELTVVEVFDGTPAARAGLRAGDVIVRVNGTAVAGMPLERTVDLIRGPQGTRVDLQVRRRGVPELFVLPIQREEILVDFVVERVFDDVGYVLLRGFPEPATEERVEQAIAGFQEQGLQGLILDLRGNSGGRLDVGSRLLSRFLPPGSELYQQVDRTGRQRTRAAADGERYSLPLVVLVDGGTASMGEIFAAAVQDHHVATVLGTTTSGSVAAAQVYPLGDGSALQVTVMEITSAAGNRLNGVGVQPDEVVESDPADAEAGDPVLERALAVLHDGVDLRLSPARASLLPVAA